MSGYKSAGFSPTGFNRRLTVRQPAPQVGGYYVRLTVRQPALQVVSGVENHLGCHRELKYEGFLSVLQSIHVIALRQRRSWRTIM